MNILSKRSSSRVNLLSYLWPARNEIIVSVIVVGLISSLTFFIFLRDSNQDSNKQNQSSVSVTTNTEVTNGTQNTANLGSTINWKKQVNAPGVEQLVDGTVVEQISADQEYVYDSLELPEGWTATWSFDPVGTPENQRTYRSEPPDESLGEKPTYIKINTGSKDTFKPSVVAPIGKPVAEKVLDSGKKPSAPILYKKKIFLIMRGVKAAEDPTNANQSLYTIDCYDTISQARCPGYPGYFSSDAGPITANPESLGIQSGTKDLNTSQFFESYLDDGTYGNEGRLYFPAQKGKSYGVGCINILLTKNCGYTSLGDSDALAPSGSLPFPTLISGFAEKDGKLYGHANDMDLPRQKIVCFDLNSDDEGLDAPCDGYDESTLSKAPTYKMSIHRYIYRSVGSHSMIGNKLYYAVDYLRDATTFDSQTDLKAVLYCFDTAELEPCQGTGGNEGWTHPFGGAPISKVSEADVTNTFVWKKDGQDHAICASLGLQNETLTFKTPSIRCYNPDNGIFFQGGGDAGFPSFIFPSTWWPAYLPFVPWRMGPNELNTTNAQGEPITYFALYSTADSNIDSTIQNGATLCYNWETQRPCAEFGYQVRYWFEVGNGQSGDVGYTYDGACMWASGNKNILWSFDPRTGEYPCRSSQTELTISAGDNQYYCDNTNRAFSWDKVRLAKTNLYNFHTLKVTVRNADTDAIIPVQGNNTNDMKQSGTLDISSVPYQQNQRLKLEVVPNVLNTSPWAGNKTPKVSAILNSDNVQYCFDTKPKQFCDLRQLTSVAGSSVVTDTNTITGQSTGTVNVRVPDNDQCYRDVKVSVNANKSQIRAGDDVSYTVRVEHKGNLSLPNAQTRGRIQGARIEVTIPNNLEYVSSTNGGRREGNKVIWSSQEFIPESITQRQVTFRPKTVTSQMSPANVIYAATTQEPVTVQAAVISGDDIFQSDNTSSNNSVILITETPDDTGGGDTETPPDEGQSPDDETEQPAEDTPETPAIVRLNPFDPSDQNESSGEQLTPRFISSVIPPSLRNQTESLFKFVNSAVTPIPNPVAVALPYGTIAFLMAFASIYVYQAAQEGKNRKTLLNSYKRFKRTEELRRNYVDLTSHYLNTPIATMQSSIELMESLGEAPGSIVEAAKLRLDRVVQHVRLLLSKADELTSSAKVTADVMEPIAKKRSFLSAGVVIPVIIVLLITAVINAIFVWADKYSASLFTIAIQSLYFGLSFIAMLLAFNSYRNQKYATAVAEHELGLEKKLTATQTAFIANTSKTIEGDIVELEQMSPTIATSSKGSTFVNGLQSLKKATSKLDYLNRLTNHSVVPTLPNQTIKSLTDDVVASLQDYANQKRVTLEVNIESGLTALVDEDGLRQMLYSTIHNAIKFNRPGGRAILSISRQGNSNIKIIVKDNGQGIAKDKLDQLFEPFGRGTDSKEYNFEGFGLDLYMNKLIAEQCGGSISLESTRDVGTTLTILLPA